MARFLTGAAGADSVQAVIPPHVRRAVIRLESLHQQGGDPVRQLAGVEAISASFSKESGLPSAQPRPSRHFGQVLRVVAGIGAVALGVGIAAGFAQLAGASQAAGAAVEYLAETTFTAGLAGIGAARCLRERQDATPVASLRCRSEEVVSAELALEAAQLRLQTDPPGHAPADGSLTLSVPYRTLAHVVTHRLRHPHV